MKKKKQKQKNISFKNNFKKTARPKASIWINVIHYSTSLEVSKLLLIVKSKI